MHWIDIGIIVIIALSVLTGLIRGLVKELIAIVIWAAALGLAYKYAYLLETRLSAYIHEKSLRTVAAFVAVLLAVLVLGAVFNTLVGFIIKRTGLSGTDRILGMVFGLIRGVLVIAIILVGIKITKFPHENFSRESVLYKQFDPIVNWTYEHTPNFIKQMTFKTNDQTLVTDI